MRCRAYMLPAEIYAEVEAQILENLRSGDLEQLSHLVGEADLEVELLAGEWRVLMSELEDYYQVIDLEDRIARMVVSPSELAAFVEELRDPDRQARWRPIAFGLAELTDALPAGTDLVAVVFMEEDDDWLWQEPVYEIIAIRPEVFSVLEPHLREAMAAGDWSAMARFAEDHAEGAVDFSSNQWSVLLRHAEQRVPELLPIFKQRLAIPRDYTQIREALTLVADARYQPSLDAWLRVHAENAQYALYFRDASLEQREVEGSGLLRLTGRSQTAKMRAVSPQDLESPPQAVPEAVSARHTVPLRSGDLMSSRESAVDDDN